ncbi:MAG TPA: energy-coupling factor transporter transmembrane component T [Dermatophilaceae bacterium]|nr:energy-coupling factor transporter transmembrane component T [Dermatophilaceae bacterium]
MLTGQYLPGDSPLHRVGPGVKLVGLLVLTSVLLVLDGAAALGALAAAAVLVGAGSRLAEVPARTMLAQVWPLRWWVAVLVPFQVWAQGWQPALRLAGTLVVTVAAASLVTLTTRVSEMLDALQRGLSPLQRAGVDTERIGLLFALAIRAIPVVAEALRLSREARSARGLERSPRALFTPFVLRSVRHAERVGEALAARGVDD